VLVQSVSSSAEVKPASTASFVIWVWTVKAAATAVSVKTTVGAAAGIHPPSYVVCPTVKGDVCKLGKLAVGQMDELQVAVKVGSRAALGGLVQVTSKATGRGANSFTGSASDEVVAAPKTTPGTTVTLPAPGKLPAISGTGVSPTDPSGLFPTVTATPEPSSSSLGLPPVKPHKVARATLDAATVPLDAKLIGGQLAGLAVLAGAVTIAIARLSLRTRQPQAQSAAAQSSNASAGEPPTPSKPE
jgi:hypothetical protein